MAKQTDAQILKEWQRLAAGFLADHATSPSILESCAIALRRDDPVLADKCTKEAATRIVRRRSKISR